jgi:hypothetical protein
VAESFGLGDLRDVVLDQPRLMRVAEVVEMHPGDDRGGAGVGVAVQGRPVGLAKSIRLRCLRIFVDQPADDWPSFHAARVDLK